MTAPWQERWSSALMKNYGTPPIALTKGEGAYVWDANGNRYLDLLGGIAVNALGHAHPAIVAAVTEQLQTLGHVSNLYINPRVVELAERLLDKFGQRAGCSSATPEPKPTRRHSSWPDSPAGRRSWPRTRHFTDAPWVRSP